MLIVILLVIICFTELWLIIKDDGIICSYINSAKNMAASKGWIATIGASISMILGKVKDVFPKLSKTQNSYIKIAFCPSGGLGDYIISAKIFEEIQCLCNCKIDVFCENLEYGQAIYGNRKMTTIIPYVKFEARRSSYDLAIMVEHFINIKNLNRKVLRECAPQLYDCVESILGNWNQMYVPIRTQYFRERIHFERCKCLGLNRWTELRMGEAFKINDIKVEIPMNDLYRKEWEQRIDGKKYVTINYGADKMRKNQNQLKIWPLKYYEELCGMIHKNFLDISIIQLGTCDATKINGCNEYVLGENLELTKWILKGSLCHIDCEGGLVHLATQLNTKCIVIFGPTPESMYAYPQNINLRNPECSACMGLHKDWAYKCFRKMEQPVCMYGVLPPNVYEELITVINDKEK